ncbi:hypothetical protein [Paludibacterium yongneupense]|uniref:hypothetical protein n=1 Tax=Paludibacterium yongneupense TaxID=400061 RepID=UPI00041BC5B3|nr:hypothetical protein [Paludibacterium yongneupense]
MKWPPSSADGAGAVAGLDLGADAVRIVELAPLQQGWRLAAHASVALRGRRERDDIAAAIAEAWHRAGAVAERVVMALPAACCAFGLRRLPAYDFARRALGGARALVADPSRHHLDCLIVAREAGLVTAVLCAAPRDAVASRVALAEQAGLAVPVVDIDCFALLRAGGLSWPSRTAIMLELDAAVWRLTRLGGLDAPLADEGSADETLMTTLQRRLAVGSPQRILLAGERAPALEARVRAACGIDVSCVVPWHRIATTSPPSSGYALACGLARWPEEA